MKLTSGDGIDIYRTIDSLREWEEDQGVRFVHVLAETEQGKRFVLLHDGGDGELVADVPGGVE